MKNTDTSKKTILIAAGGTGGHIFPGIAIANELKINKSIRIIWFGSKAGMENHIVPKYNYSLQTVNSVGLRGKSWSKLVKAPFLLLIALWQTIIIFIQVKPQLVLGMGGFTAGLAGVVAWIFRVPLFIHEQNAIAGSTNRILTKLATRTYQAFDGAFQNKNMATTIGNPIIFKPQEKQKNTSKQLNILVIGGSLGAEILNNTIPQLKTLLNIIHQSGRGYFTTLKHAYQNSINSKAKIIEFIEDMAPLYAWSDIVICRAGAMTVSELMLSGSASILIPYPYAIDNHQTANAKILSDNQAAILLPQNKLTPQKLDDILAGLPQDDILNMSHNAQKLATANSAKDLTKQLYKTLNLTQ